MKILPLSISPSYKNNYCPNIAVNNNKQDSTSRMQVPADVVRANFMPSFKSLCRSDSKTGMPLYSGFYRDYPSLLYTAAALNKSFPDGTNIIVGACSSGEDVISLYSLIPNIHRYNIVGLDTSDDALQLADKNIYTLLPSYPDRFLANKNQDEVLSALSDFFENVMEPAPKPDFVVNMQDGLSDEKDTRYFRMKDEHRKNIGFDKFDMNNIDKYNTNQEVGAILFRNTLYMLTDNYLSESIMENKKEQHLKVDRAAIVNSFVDKIYKRLMTGGLFVLGEIPAEHVYLADKHTPKNNRIMIDNVPMFDESIDYYMADPEVEICKKSPLYMALEKDGRFKPVYNSITQWMNFHQEVPTVWQKVK